MDLKTTLKNFDKQTIQVFGEMFAESIKMATEHTQMSPETKVNLEAITEKIHENSEALKEFCNGNSAEHKTIIEHLVHTNGNITELQGKEIENKAIFKTWRTAIGIAFTICLAISGFITSFYFMERGNQQAKFDEVIKMRVELTSLANQLDRLQLTQ